MSKIIIYDLYEINALVKRDIKHRLYKMSVSGYDVGYLIKNFEYHAESLFRDWVMQYITDFNLFVYTPSQKERLNLPVEVKYCIYSGVHWALPRLLYKSLIPPASLWASQVNEINFKRNHKLVVVFEQS